MKKYIVVDRIEGEAVICEREDEQFITLDRTLLPADVAEGDCLLQIEGVWMLDKEETERRLEEVQQYLKCIFENN